MSPNDVYVVIEGYEKRMRGEWERTRMVAYVTHTHSMVDKKYKAKSPERFFPLPWDKEKKVNVVQGPKDVLEFHRKRLAELQKKKEQEARKT